MTYLHSIILGIIEGISEFLPISSTGHMILASSAMHIPKTDFLKSFEVIIQLGAILAVVVMYGKMLWKNSGLLKKVVAAFIPTAVIGLAFYKIVKTYLFESNLTVVLALAIGGILILLFDRREKRLMQIAEQNAVSQARVTGNMVAPAQPAPTEAITYKQAFWVGIAQSVAIIPGVSRSAATIIGGRLLGLSRMQIVEFSFLLAIPTMAAAAGLDILKNYKSILSGQFGLLLVGFIVSFVVALLAIRGFLSYIKKYSFSVFGWYRIAIAIVAAFLLFR